MRKFAYVVLMLVAAVGGLGAAIALAAGETTGTNTACATATLPAHTVGVDATDVYTISGTATTSCNTQTYTIPTSTTTATVTQTVTQPTTSSTTSTTTTTPSSLSGPFKTAPSGAGSQAAGLPRSDSACAGAVATVAENRPDNVTANNTMPANNGAGIAWGTGDDSFKLWPQERAFVTGHYTGTTDEILQWGACKWGLDENLLRADAVDESHWHQADVGDLCGGDGSTGIGSYSILQIKNKNCSGTVVDGGWPDTQKDTALGVDFTASQDRACFDGAFNGWLYDKVSVQQDAANHESYSDPVPLTGDHGWDYVMWGCIGHWYSGGWWDSGATSYINTVQGYYTSKPWLQSGF